MASDIEDLHVFFNTLQQALCANVLSQHSPPLPPGYFNAVNDQEVEHIQIKDSIVSAFVGTDFKQVIDEDSGQWLNSEYVVEGFQKSFEDRIKYLFMVDSSPSHLTSQSQWIVIYTVQMLIEFS